jgi:NAD(P)-dependent dehydrogenase (short-subunit alcohol dehydrogenase family)
MIYQRFKDRVILVVGNGGDLEQVVAEKFRAEQGTVLLFPLSVPLTESAIARQINEITDQYGHIDIGIFLPHKEYRQTPLHELSLTDWQHSVTKQMERLFLVVQQVAQAMMKSQRGGNLLYLCSETSLFGSDADVGSSVLVGMVRQFMHASVVQWATYRIRSNMLLYAGMKDGRDTAVKTPAGQITFQTPYLFPLGTPDDIAEAALFLASDDAVFFDGVELAVDGGIGAGTDIYNGGTSIGNAILEMMNRAGVGNFDEPQTLAGMMGGDKSRPYNFSGVGAGLAPTPKMTPQTVLITGVSKGLGRALTDRFIAEGHFVLGCARSFGAIKELQRLYGPPHRFEAVDVADRASVETWAAALNQDGIVPDYILNNAAIIGEEHVQVWKQSAQNFERVLFVNIMAAVNTIHAFVPMMLRRMKGVIVNFSSGWGRGAAPKVGPYAVSKWGIEGLSQVLAAELPNKMACVSLHPGIIHTETMGRSFGESASLYATPEEWAKIAVPFLLSLSPKDNGKAVSVPGMTEFKGMGRK